MDEGSPLGSIDWDAPGSLSIVVQGGLFHSNVIEVANACQHWRELFPKADIVLSLSSTDLVEAESYANVLEGLKLVGKHKHDTLRRAAVEIIDECCDTICLADKALPLPPIKSDSPKLNNMNLQIAAAKTGLGLARGRYVLRTRSDLLFLDRTFLRQYAEAQLLPRGDARALEERVLISWLFTLNPYTVERLPLHFSDWFHFGLTRDVRKLWDVPLVTLADALHFRTFEHPAGSNTAERLFNIRIGVEQHIIYHCFKASLPDLKLANHNDLAALPMAMDILVDNFVLCDLVGARCVFDKYEDEFHDHRKTYWCITPEDWLAMAKARDVDYRMTLAPKIREHEATIPFQLEQPFPRIYKAGQLKSTVGGLINGNIVSMHGDGVLHFGPYVALPSGNYLAIVKLTTLEGPGEFLLRVTSDVGTTLLASKKFRIDREGPNELEIPFNITKSNVKNLEVVGEIRGLRGAAVESIVIAERKGALADNPIPRPHALRRICFAAQGFLTRAGAAVKHLMK